MILLLYFPSFSSPAWTSHFNLLFSQHKARQTIIDSKQFHIKPHCLPKSLRTLPEQQFHCLMKRFLKCFFELLTQIFHSVLWERSGHVAEPRQKPDGDRTGIVFRGELFYTWVNGLTDKSGLQEAIFDDVRKRSRSERYYDDAVPTSKNKRLCLNQSQIQFQTRSSNYFFFAVIR